MYVYRRQAQLPMGTPNAWQLFDTLVAVRNHSSFGFSVDVSNASVVVGANGFYRGQFGNNVNFEDRNQRTYITLHVGVRLYNAAHFFVALLFIFASS